MYSNHVWKRMDDKLAEWSSPVNIGGNGVWFSERYFATYKTGWRKGATSLLFLGYLRTYHKAEFQFNLIQTLPFLSSHQVLSPCSHLLFYYALLNGSTVDGNNKFAIIIVYSLQHRIIDMGSQRCWSLRTQVTSERGAALIWVNSATTRLTKSTRLQQDGPHTLFSLFPPLLL